MASDRYIGIDYDRMRNYRLKRTQDQMKKEGIELLISWDPYTIRYTTGAYVTVPNRYMLASSVMIPAEGDPYAYVLASFSPFALQEQMPWMKGKVWSNLGSIKFAQTTDALSRYKDALNKVLDENQMKNPVVALDGCVNDTLFKAFLGENGVNNVVNGTHTMFRARAVKNPDEIALMKQAAKNADAAFADIADAIRPGVRECELVGIGMNKLYALGCDEAQEFVCSSGPRTNPLFVDFTDRTVDAGELVVVDINGNSYNGYKTCVYRTFCCGKASQEQKDGYKIALDMMYDGIAAVKPGASTKDIVAPWPSSPQFWGYDDWQHCRGFALGHGLGLSLHESPEMFWPWYLPGEGQVLEEGMVMAIETYYGPKGGKWGGVRLEEQVVVTADGYEVINKFPIQELTECWR
jgi:Xaa-Pro aminopeptidase